MSIRTQALTTIVMLGSMAAPAAAGMPTAVPVDMVCAAESARAERTYSIPSQLLDAISLVESGRYDKENKGTLAWPWTVTSGGEGKYFPTKREAIAEVQRLKSKGVENIDVGCMQINLKYHPRAFDSLETAFDPAANVTYAARFLTGLQQSTGNWVTAASYYHSQTPHLAAAYRERLHKVLQRGGSREVIANMNPFKGQNVSVAPVSVTTPAPAPSAITARPAQTPHTSPVPSSQRVQEIRRDWQASQNQTRDETKKIADAYRQARLVEYQLRRAERSGQ